MNRSQERTIAKVVTTAILIVAIVIVFYFYSKRNDERIAEQNASYIMNSTIEAAGWIDDILQSAEYSIANTARLYGQTLDDSEVRAEDLQNMSDRMIFDYVDFIDADGIKTNMWGEQEDLSDSPYYKRGMQGESGMDGTYTSKKTGERQVIFYAPVRSQGEIVGVLTGHYLESRMSDILEMNLFGESMPSVLCLPDGTVVSGRNSAQAGTNVIDYLRGHVSEEDLSCIRDAIALEESYAFTFLAEKGSTKGYVTSLSGNTWTLIRLFPEEALNRMQKRADRSGIILEVELIGLFAAYMLFLLLQEGYQKKRLRNEKQQAERIVTGINTLFSRFVLVDLKTDRYQYVNEQGPSFRELPKKGQYTDFIAFFQDKIASEYDMAPMGMILGKEALRETLTPKKPYERYEYQIRREDGASDWENMAVIGLEWDGDTPVSVLLAIQEITAIKQREIQTQQALREAYLSAEAANHAKSDFLSRMSHDIRTPMNAIMGMTTIASMHMDDKARVEDCLNKITISSKHLLGLINEVLDMSKIESGKLELTEEEFDLSETVNELLGIFHSQMLQKDQKLSVTIKDMDHEKVLGDSQRLSQVLVNIMGNAVKFTPEGGCISVYLSESSSHLAGTGCYEFCIADTGIGMDEEFAARMFEPFAQAHDSRISKMEGTGLGMSIAKNIVNMMNGDIQVKSRKGLGTTIKVHVFLKYATDEKDMPGMPDMPEGYRVLVVDDKEEACENACSILKSMNVLTDYCTNAADALDRILNGEKEYKAVLLDWKMPDKDGVQVTREIREKLGDKAPVIVLMAYDWSAVEKEAVSAGVNAFLTKPLFRSRLAAVLKKITAGPGEKAVDAEVILKQDEFADKKILLVEDNEMNMEIACEILGAAGFEIDTAENGQEAVDRLMETAPGTYRVVLMDIQMPVMNGYEAARAIRVSGRRDLEKIPILAMTADAFTEDVRKAEAAGMNGHIAKPINITKLMETLREWT